jgi:hypothetical protein
MSLQQNPAQWQNAEVILGVLDDLPVVVLGFWTLQHARCT